MHKDVTTHTNTHRYNNYRISPNDCPREIIKAPTIIQGNMVCINFLTSTPSMCRIENRLPTRSVTSTSLIASFLKF